MQHKEINEYYSTEIEKNRLEMEFFQLEGIRTKEIISRYLSNEKMRIIDIGGGAGFYSFWLKQQGHVVNLVDLSTKNIELANQYAVENNIYLDKIEVCNATDLCAENDQFDIALLLGPLYHLTKKNQRIKALEEAKRVLKPDGLLICAVISRYASLFDGFNRDLINDNEFQKIVFNDLKNGIHINHTNNKEYFTTAYFHTPKDIKNEIRESGLSFERLIAVESFGWIINDFESKRKNKSYMDTLLHTLRLVEENDDLIAISPHILGIAKKTLSQRIV